MPLKFILGEKKSGKTSFIINELKNNKNSVIIVPEQTMFLYEKMILDTLGEEHFFNISIVSFKKLAKNLLKDDKNFNRIKLLDRDTKNLLTEKILLSKRDELVTFKNAVSSPLFAEKISAQISEFKKYLVNKETLISLSAREDIGKSLRDKLKDLSCVYNEYEERIKDIYCDLDDLLVTASDKIISEGLYAGKNIYIDSFTGFTGEEIYMIKAFLRSGANVNVSLLNLPKRCEGFGDLGYTVKKTREKLVKAAEEEGCETKEIILSYDGQKNSQIKYIADNFSLNPSEKYTKSTGDVKITGLRNIKYECDCVASEIIKNIKEDNGELSRMAIVLPDMKEYGQYIKESLSKFNLPFYSNEKKSVYDMPVAALINNVFNIILSGNRMDVILGYIKSGYFFNDEPEKIYNFEAFLRKTGVRAYQLLRKDICEILEEKKSYNFKISDEGGIKEVYNRVILPVIKLKNKISSMHSAKDFSLSLYEFFGEIHLDKALGEQALSYEKSGDITRGKQLIQVYNYILESMERTTLVLSGVKVSFTEYKNIIIASLKNKNIASIPVLSDSIFVTEPMGFFNDSYSFVYIIGANEGKLPNLAFSEGIINEEERAVLKELGIELSMSAELKMMENKLKLYDIIASPDRKLYISYADYSKSGSEQLASEFVTDISDLLSIPESKEEITYLPKRSLLKDVLSSFSGKTVCEDNKIISYLSCDKEYDKLIKDTVSNLKNPSFGEVSVDKNKMNKLLGGSLRMSVTNMEKYNQCAYAYFVRYVLRAKENEEFYINRANLGSVMHLILEKFSKGLQKDNTDFSQIDDKYIEAKLPKIIETSINEIQNGVFASDVKGEVFKRKLRAIAYKTINLIRLHFIKGSFKTVGFEVDFGKEGSLLDGIVFDVGENRKLVLNGVIDRVDKFKKDDEEYIRIVDYKSSEKTLDFYEIVHGLKLQLAVYLMTVIGKEKIDKIKPGGMLYLTLKTPMASVASPTDTESVEAQIRGKLLMKGFYLNTQDVAEAMDKAFKDSSSSEIVDLELDKNGIPKDKNTLSVSEFEALLKMVRESIKKQGKNIFDGRFDIAPIKEGDKPACKYCPYSAICMFDNENSEYTDIKKMPRDAIFPKADTDKDKKDNKQD